MLHLLDQTAGRFARRPFRSQEFWDYVVGAHKIGMLSQKTLAVLQSFGHPCAETNAIPDVKSLVRFLQEVESTGSDENENVSFSSWQGRGRGRRAEFLGLLRGQGVAREAQASGIFVTIIDGRRDYP